MKFYRFVLGLLAVWRITHLLQAEDGPGDLLVYQAKGVSQEWREDKEGLGRLML